MIRILESDNTDYRYVVEVDDGWLSRKNRFLLESVAKQTEIIEEMGRVTFLFYFNCPLNFICEALNFIDWGEGL